MQGRIDAVGQQIASLADTFVKNLLATAGFILGTVLSKLLEPSLGPLYPVILGAFVVYLLVILAIYYPVLWMTHQLNRADYDRSLKSSRRLFTEGDLKDLVGEAFDKRHKLFLTAFCSTLAAYVALAALGLWLAAVYHPPKPPTPPQTPTGASAPPTPTGTAASKPPASPSQTNPPGPPPAGKAANPPTARP